MTEDANLSSEMLKYPELGRLRTEDVNCAPLLEVKVAGMPNLDIQVEIKALTQVSVEIEDKGTASGQRVVLSIIVRM